MATIPTNAPTAQEINMDCKNCGGKMIGDGIKEAYCCENMERPMIEPDSKPVYCQMELETAKIVVEAYKEFDAAKAAAIKGKKKVEVNHVRKARELFKRARERGGFALRIEEIQCVGMYDLMDKRAKQLTAA